MKRSIYRTSFEAAEIQKQINNTKHERARKLLQSKLITTHIESFVDLDTSYAVIWVLNTSYGSKMIFDELKDMSQSIMKQYPKITKVDIYGHDAIMEEYDRGELKQFPKSSIIKPELEGDKDQLPLLMVDGIEYEYCDKETKKMAELFMDLRDNSFNEVNKKPVSESSGDLEAGEIRIITETIDSIKRM
jgi:hypothetical protein